MAAQQLARPIPAVSRTRLNGARFEEGADIVGERVYRGITILRFRTESPSHDVIEIGGQLRVQTAGRGNRSVACDCAGDLWGAGVQFMRRTAGQDLVQNGA